MKPPAFFVVVDRGHIKAFEFKNGADGRHHGMALLEQADIREAFLKYDEQYTDQAGAFPSYSAPGVANSIAERTSLETEKRARISRKLIELLHGWLNKYTPRTWGLAAASDLQAEMLGDLDKSHRNNLVCNIKRDLVRVPTAELMDYITRECAEKTSPVHT